MLCTPFLHYVAIMWIVCILYTFRIILYMTCGNDFAVLPVRIQTRDSLEIYFDKSYHHTYISDESFDQVSLLASSAKVIQSNCVHFEIVTLILQICIFRLIQEMGPPTQIMNVSYDIPYNTMMKTSGQDYASKSLIYELWALFSLSTTSFFFFCVCVC